VSLFKKNFLTLSLAAVIFSLLLVVIVFFINSPVLLIIFLILYLIAVLFAIYNYSNSLSVSFGRLVRIVQKGSSLLPASEEVDLSSMEFKNMERAMRAITLEVSRRFENAKSESSRLEAILNGMSEAVFAMDHSLKLHIVNPKARELFNLGNRDVKKMNLLEATRSTELVETAKKVISGGAPLEFELAFRTGKEQFFQVYASPLAKTNDSDNGSSQGSGAVLVLQEITRLVKLERIRKDFVANVSHELRTPIQLIKGFSETLLDSVKDEQDIHFIEIIRKSAGTMENLTNDLLILADLENADNNTRDMEEVKIISLINESVSSMEPRAKEKQIEIIVKCQEDLKANLYSSLILQALINLIDNGIKYSQPKSKLWISASLENNTLLFEVRDKGIGIPAEHLGKIFERFYRVDRARSRDTQSAQAGGTGLGLSIVRHIALLHKGNTEVESHAGEGSIFRIRIPNQNHRHH